MAATCATPSRASTRQGKPLASLLLGTAFVLALHTLWWSAAPSPGAQEGSAAFVGSVPTLPRVARSVTALRGKPRPTKEQWKAGVTKQDLLTGGGAANSMRKGKKGPGKTVDTSPPKIHQGSPIIFNGKEVGKLNGTMTEYKVDIWSGAHPIWQGKKGKVMLDASSVTKFQEKFASVSSIFGEAGLEQLEKNRKLKQEQEERKKLGLKSY